MFRPIITSLPTVTSYLKIQHHGLINNVGVGTTTGRRGLFASSSSVSTAVVCRTAQQQQQNTTAARSILTTAGGKIRQYPTFNGNFLTNVTTTTRNITERYIVGGTTGSKRNNVLWYSSSSMYGTQLSKQQCKVAIGVVGPLHISPTLFNNNSKTRYSHHLPSSLLLNNAGSVSTFSSFFGGGGGNRRPPGGSTLASGIGLLGAASVLFGKTKYVLAALKLTKLASLGSMVLTVGTYTMFFGFPYAVGMVGLILIHETGHALVMYQRNIPFSPMVFVPFMGAVIAMKQQPRDAWEDALVAAGGPALGSAGAAVVALAAHSTNSQLLFALADFGFMINLFNLLPIGSMDGGRIAGALSKWVGVGGIGFGGFLAYQGVVQNPLFYLILLSGGYETFQRFYNPHQIPPNYYKITPMQRTILTGGYLGLILSLLVAMDMNQRYRKPPEVLIREREIEKSWDYR